MRGYIAFAFLMLSATAADPVPPADKDAQEQQIDLLQQQLAGQHAQLQALQEANDRLAGLQSQLAAQQAARVESARRYDTAVATLRDAEAQLAIGQSDVDLTGVADALPVPARDYVRSAEQALDGGDYFYARQLLVLAQQAAGSVVIPSP